MNSKKIKKLVELLKESNLSMISYKDQEFEVVVQAHPHHVPVQSLPMAQGSLVQSEGDQPPKTSQKSINALLVGIFYAKAASDKPPYVSVGDRVEKGDVICIIESMKVMNEIRATHSGVVEAILVNDGDLVEYDQPLITLV